MLLVLNLPLVGVLARVAAIRPHLLMPFISIICLVGVYCINNSLFDVWVMIGAGFIGFFFRKWKYPIAPFIIGMVLGPMTENNFRQTLMLFRGNLHLIFTHPIALTFILLSVALIGYRIFYFFYEGKRSSQRVQTT